MSETQSQTVEKTVTIEAYSQPGADKREFLATLLEDIEDADMDVFARETVEDTTHTLQIGEWTERLMQYEYDDLTESIEAANVDLGDVTINTETSETTQFVHDPYDVISALRDDLGGIFADTVEGYERHAFRDYQWDGDNGHFVEFKVPYGTSVERKKVLTHQSERSADNRYETSDEVADEDLPQGFQLVVKLEAGDDATMESLSQTFVQGAYKFLAGMSAVHKVRMSDCKTKTEKEGECYNI